MFVHIHPWLYFRNMHFNSSHSWTSYEKSLSCDHFGRMQMFVVVKYTNLQRWVKAWLSRAYYILGEIVCRGHLQFARKLVMSVVLICLGQYSGAFKDFLTFPYVFVGNLLNNNIIYYFNKCVFVISCSFRMHKIQRRTKVYLMYQRRTI